MQRILKVRASTQLAENTKLLGRSGLDRGDARFERASREPYLHVRSKPNDIYGANCRISDCRGLIIVLNLPLGLVPW